MEDNTLVESSVSATINAPIENVNIPAWCFTLAESEYQACSPAHYSAGTTTAPDGRRMSINVEAIGGSLIVQHYVEEIGRPDHLRLVSDSDVFTRPVARRLRPSGTCRLRRSTATCGSRTRCTAADAELQFWVKKHPFGVFARRGEPDVRAHNRQRRARRREHQRATPWSAFEAVASWIRRIWREIGGAPADRPVRLHLRGGKVWISESPRPITALAHAGRSRGRAKGRTPRLLRATSSVSAGRLRVVDAHRAGSESGVHVESL